MAVLWFIIIVQFGLLSWLVTDKYRPKAVDYWEKAQGMIERWRADDETNWERDFKDAQGIIEPAKPVKPVKPHEIAKVWTTSSLIGKEQIHYKCRCGFSDNTFNPDLVETYFNDHLKTVQKVAFYNQR